MAESIESSLDDSEILRILYSQNPWWVQKPIPQVKLKEFKRRDYYKLQPQLDNDKIIALIGARRVGKTTLLYQVINKLLGRINPQNILLVNLDDPYLHVTLSNMDKILTVYSTNILKQSFDSLSEPVYMFLDEIQSLQDWQLVLKRWYDLGYKIKFIVSGSSSIGILEGTSESLVGRIRHQIVLPMKFLEYVRFKEQNQIGELVDSINARLRGALKNAVTQKDPGLFHNEADLAIKELTPYQDRIVALLQEYFIKGGYPENAGIDDLTTCGENLREYLQLTLYKDIMRVSEVRDPKALEKLFAIISRESSQRVNRTNLAKTLVIKRSTTLNTYIHLLKTAYLISESEFYSKSAAKQTRRETKMYVHDVGIRNVSASVFDDQVLTNPVEIGKIVETVAADHTKRLKFNLDSTVESAVFYWQDNYEVDLVIELFQNPLPIEIKYKERVSLSDLQGLRKFDNEFHPPMMITVTKNQLEIHDKIVFVPIWLYLLMC